MTEPRTDLGRGRTVPGRFPSGGDMVDLLRRLFERDVFKMLLLAFVGATLFLSKLDGNGLAAFDDAYYAQKAKEISRTGELMRLYHDGEACFDNPPLFMWLVAGSYRLFGVSEYAAKLPSALLGVATVLLLFVFVRRLVNADLALLAAGVLVLTPTFIKYSRHAMIDVPLAFFVLLAFYSLVRALRGEPRCFLVWGLAVSASIWLKSLLGGFPLLISTLYILGKRRLDLRRSGLFWSGCGIVVVLGFSWYYVSYWRYGRVFLEGHFGGLILTAMTPEAGTTWVEHLSYLRAIVAYYWPWLPVFVLGLYALVVRRKLPQVEPMLLTLWIFVFLVVMSLMGMRKTWYMVPILPAMAIVTAVGLDGVLPASRRKWLPVVSVTFVVAVSLLVLATPVSLSSQREPDVRLIAPYVRHLVTDDTPLLLLDDTEAAWWAVNNPLLFYTDRSADAATVEMVRESFSGAGPAYAVARLNQLPALRAVYPDVFIVKQGQDLALVANRTVDTATVVPLDFAR